MDRNTLVAELLGHGNHMVVTGSNKPEDMAKSMGLMLLALGEMLEPGMHQNGTLAGQKFGSGTMPRQVTGARHGTFMPRASARF
ncbi:MAG TPA: hypothetical protein VHW69_17280 [Rhizomicrobium sp.]|jgi:hypothetical protein|nr:hypothetical protein [Rhizomicrobium sp.]